MSYPILSCAEVRAVEQKAVQSLGLPSLVLMENAGRNLAELLVTLGIAGRVVVCCGKGNNGGDGLVLARHLDNHQFPVQVLFFGDPAEAAPDAAVNLRILTGSGVKVDVHRGIPDRETLRVDLATADWVVDALFGTGLKGPLGSPFDDIVASINACSAKVLSADIPSGLDGDSGRPLGPTVRAHHTATFLAMKAGLVVESAREWTGQVHLLDIGLPRRCLPIS